MDCNEFLKHHIFENEDDIYTMAIQAMGDDYKANYAHKRRSGLALYRMLEDELKLAGNSRLVDALRQYSDIRTDTETFLANAMFVYGSFATGD